MNEAGKFGFCTKVQFSLTSDPQALVVNWQHTPNPDAQFAGERKTLVEKRLVFAAKSEWNLPMDVPPFSPHSSAVKHVPSSPALVP